MIKYINALKCSALIMLLLLSGCAQMQEVSPVNIPFYDAKPEASVSEELTVNPPRTVAILPFGDLDNDEDKKSAHLGLLRKTLNSHFKALPFRFSDIETVDNALRKDGLTGMKKINAASPERLGKVLDVDAVIYGNIDSAVNFTGGVYSVTEYKGVLRMVDTRNGQELWKVKHFEKILGGVLENSAELVSLIESQMDNAKTRLAYERCADMFSREVIATIPEVNIGEEEAQQIIDNAQIIPAEKSSFGLFDKFEIQLKGSKGLAMVYDIGEMKESMPLVEVFPGTYKGEYTVVRGDKAENIMIVARVVDPQGESYGHIPVAGPLTIDAMPPQTPKGVMYELGLNGDVMLKWSLPGSGAANKYEIYRADNMDFDYRLVGRTSQNSYSDAILNMENPPSVIFYQIVASDINNNKSNPSEPLKVELR